MKYQALTDKVLKAFWAVYHKLGYGFLEKVYEQAMLIELQKMGLQAVVQYPIRVYYDGQTRPLGSSMRTSWWKTKWWLN